MLVSEFKRVTAATREQDRTMMIRQAFLTGSLILSLTMATSANAECSYPSRVDIPDGATSDKDAMLEGQKAVKQYVTDMEAYLECIVNEEQNAKAQMDDLDPETEQQRDDMLNKKYNAAVEEMEKVAAAFNAEVQAYRAKQE